MRLLRLLPTLVCLFVAVASQARPRLVPVADAALVTAKSSNPAALVRVGSQVFFTANDGLHGTELWRSDGTAAGTYMVSDLGFGISGSDPFMVGTIGNSVLFRTRNNDTALWRSDGTAAGTVKVFTFPTPASSYNYSVTVTAADTKAYVIVQQSYDKPADLWVTDGTDTRLIGAFKVDLSFGANGKLYFLATDETVGSQFWVSDGTLLGTHMVQRSVECSAHVACGPLPKNFFRIGPQVLFGTDDGLWKTDGTPQGTSRIAATPNPALQAASGSVAYFLSQKQLWKTNGTAAGTQSSGITFEDALIGPRVISDGRLIYALYLSRAELWRSDGTFAGTQRIGSWAPADVGILGQLGTRIFLNGVSSFGSELWIADADSPAPPSPLKDLDPRLTTAGAASGTPGVGAEIGGRLLFPAADYLGRELWESDGTTAGTRQFANIAPESPGGFISGTVRAQATGQPISNAIVRLCTNICEASVPTDPQGRYRFDGVIPGTYTVRASSFVHLSSAHPSPVTVQAGFETTGIDVNLVAGGRITGKVIRKSNGVPLAARVWIFDSSGNTVGSAYTSGPGVYRSGGLPTGTYYLEATPLYGDPVVPQRHRGVNCPVNGCGPAEGELVSVTVETETTVDFSLIDFGTISGTVTDVSNGQPLAGVQVSFTRDGQSSAGAMTTTDASGNYRSPMLNAGSYAVGTYHGDFRAMYYPDRVCPETGACTPGSTVTVSLETDTNGINLALTPARGRITGIVRDANGVPFVNTRVLLKNVDESYYGGGDAYTDASGRYVIGNVLPGRYYVWALDELYPNIDCGDFNYCSRAGATPIELTDGTTRTLDLSLLSRQITISGRLLDAQTDQAIGGERGISVYDQNKNQIWQGEATFTGDTYSRTIITRATSFYVMATATGYRHTAYPAGRMTCPEYQPCVFPPDAVLIPMGATTGRDIRMARYGTISGTVYNAVTGKPQAGELIQFKPVTLGLPLGYARSDEAGRYRWDRAEGSYYVYFDPIHEYEFQGQVYRDRNCTSPCDPAIGDAVTAPEGTDVIGIDFHLAGQPTTGKISGRIIDDATGLPVANASVNAKGTSGSGRASARSDAQGYYTLENIAPYDWLKSGTYTLYVEAGDGYYVARSGGTHCADFYACDLYGGTPVTITAPNTTTGVDFRLIRLRITSVTPARGPTSGGTTITIKGTNFTPQATVLIGGKAATVLSATATQLVVTTPPAPMGYAHVTVKLSDYLSRTLAQAFLYNTFTFTDPLLTARSSPLRRIHIEELRTAVNQYRAEVSLAAFNFTDPSLTGKRPRTVHILELRTALDQARAARGQAKLIYKYPLTAGTPVRATDVLEIRDGLR